MFLPVCSSLFDALRPVFTRSALYRLLCGILPGMTQSGEPTNNALAERVNGTFKEEFSFNTTLKFKTFKSVKAVQ
jgi:hypothetical protein